MKNWSKHWPVIETEKYKKIKNTVYDMIMTGTEFAAGHW